MTPPTTNKTLRALEELDKWVRANPEGKAIIVYATKPAHILVLGSKALKAEFPKVSIQLLKV